MTSIIFGVYGGKKGVHTCINERKILKPILNSSVNSQAVNSPAILGTMDHIVHMFNYQRSLSREPQHCQQNSHCSESEKSCLFPTAELIDKNGNVHWLRLYGMWLSSNLFGKVALKVMYIGIMQSPNLYFWTWETFTNYRNRLLIWVRM